MLTPGEIAGIESARAAASAQVEKLDAAARETDGVMSWLFPSDARRQANAARSTLDTLTAIRDGLVESPDDDPGAVARLIASLRSMAAPAWAPDALRDNSVGDAVESGTAAEWAKKKAREAAGGALGLVPLWLWLVLAVVVLVALAPLFTAAAAFRRRG